MKNLTKLFLKLSLAIVLIGSVTTGVNAGDAEPFIVDRTDDNLIGGASCQNGVPNDCTLRTAIALINSPATLSTQIQFENSVFGNGGTILLINELVITKNVEISQTSLTAPVTIDADGSSRIFNISAGINVTLIRLRLIKGNAGGNGGGILSSGNLIIRQSTVGGDSAADGNTANQGGGIFNNGGTLTVEQSTISFNSAGSGGGGIFNSNGVDGGTGSVNVENSTLSNNSGGGGFGGGYFGFSQVGTTNATFANATIADNVAQNGGGIAVASTVTVPPAASTSTANLNNTLIGNNTAGAGNDVFTNSTVIPLPLPNSLPGSITSSGYNFIENTNGASITPMTGDQFNAGDPKLLPLSANGGLTRTHALQTTSGNISPAVDTGNSALLVDQRGFSRPVDYPNNQPTRFLAANTDIGAFEAQLIPTAASATISGRFSSKSGRGVYGVRVTMTEADGTIRTVSTNPFGYYRFANVAIGQSVVIQGNAKLYQFSARTVSITEDLTGIDFLF